MSPDETPHEIAESEEDDRVRFELRPDPDDERDYHLIITTANGTRAYTVPYFVAGLVMNRTFEAAEKSDTQDRHFQ